MAIQGFDKTFYLNAKLEQLQNDPQTAADWAGKDASFLETRLQNGFGLTAEQHYEQYGFQEGLAPNAFFSPDEYIRAKATAMFNDSDSDYLTVDAAAEDFVSIWGGNVYNHYLQYGEDEGVNPSNDFDVSAYYEAKLAQLQAEGNTDITTVEEVEAAFEAAGITALEHFLTYGQDEGLTAPAVPADEQVEVDDSVAGQTFSLTTGIDTETGTADDDTFQANVENLAGTLTQTLQAGDLIDGGEGNDTLSAVLNADAGAVTISNVENLELRSIDDNAALDMANTNAAENVTVANSVGAIALSNAGGVSNFNVNNQSSTVNVTGSTATALNLGFSNFGTAAAAGVFDINNVATSADVTLANSNASITTAASLTDLSVEATGDNALLTASLGAVETIDVSGAGSVEFGGAVYTALETLTSSAEGGVTVTATNTLTSATLGAGDDDLTVTDALTSDTVYNLGAGDDHLELQAAPAAGATLNGGEGEDTIALAKADFTTVAGYTAAQRGLISNFETLEITDALANADATYDVSVIDGITSFVAGAGVTTAESATVNGVTSGSTVGLAGVVANDGELVVNITDAATGTADELNVALDKDISKGDGATAAASTVGAAGVETVNVDSSFNATDTLAAADVLTNTLTLNNDELVTLNVAGDAALTFVADAAMEDLETINASANEAGADITVDAALTQTVTITGTAEDDIVVLSANDVVDAGAGDDAITVADQAEVTGGEGDDTFTMTASANQVSYASIQDFDAGKDTLTATGASSFNSDAITLQSNAVFSDYVEAASAGGVGELSWFQFENNTYVVNDQDAAANFVNGTDMIVELTGSVDLSDATLNGGDLTIA